jgi:hypothetical protein
LYSPFIPGQKRIYNTLTLDSFKYNNGRSPWIHGFSFFNVKIKVDLDGFWKYSRRIYYNKKALHTLKHRSARWETILLRSNILFPPDREDSLHEVIKMMIGTKISRNPYGENVAQKIIDIMKSELIK